MSRSRLKLMDRHLAYTRGRWRSCWLHSRRPRAALHCEGVIMGDTTLTRIKRPLDANKLIKYKFVYILIRTGVTACNPTTCQDGTASSAAPTPGPSWQRRGRPAAPLAGKARGDGTGRPVGQSPRPVRVRDRTPEPPVVRADDWARGQRCPKLGAPPGTPLDGCDAGRHRRKHRRGV